MKSVILGLLAETPIHPGTGRNLGVVDLPVAREAATDYPVLVGSSLKGALRDRAENSGRLNDDEVKDLFGEQDQAGGLLVSDARLLLLPVRSLTGAYRWTTCPHILERLRRDLSRAGRPASFEIPSLDVRQVWTSGNGELFLEERQFQITQAVPKDVIEAAESLIPHATTQQRLAGQLAILHDDDFAWFARYGLAIQARNVLDDGTKKSQNLWYEESLPPDTLMYALVAGRSDDSVARLQTLFSDPECYLQAGGNETVGQGWFAVRVLQSNNKEQA